MIRFLIVGTQRTGSSALGEAIGLHPRVYCGWEWTQRVPFLQKIDIAKAALDARFDVLPAHHRKHALESMDGATQVIGFRRLFRSSDKWILHPALSPALVLDRLDAHLKWLENSPDIRIIHIVRRRNATWIKSKALSSATGKYFGEAYPEDVRETVDIPAALKRVVAKNWVDNRLARLRGTNPYLRMSYEDFLRDNRRYAIEAIHFLGGDPELLPTLEMNAKPQSDSGAQVLNEDELEQALLREGLAESKLMDEA